MTNLIEETPTPVAVVVIEQPRNNENLSIAKNITGVVKFYSVQKCYGFIKRDDTNDYVFVHSTSITGKNLRRVTRSVDKGEQVQFDVVMSERSPEAINVTGPNGGPVLGSEYGLVTMQWHQYESLKKQLKDEVSQENDLERELSPRARRFVRKPIGGRRRRGSARNIDGNENRSNGEDNEHSNQGRQRRRRQRRSSSNKDAGQPQSTETEGTADASGAEAVIDKPAKGKKRNNRRKTSNRQNVENDETAATASETVSKTANVNATEKGAGSPVHVADKNSTEPKKNQRKGRRDSQKREKQTENGPDATEASLLADVSVSTGNTRIAAAFENGTN